MKPTKKSEVESIVGRFSFPRFTFEHIRAAFDRMQPTPSRKMHNSQITGYLNRMVTEGKIEFAGNDTRFRFRRGGNSGTNWYEKVITTEQYQALGGM